MKTYQRLLLCCSLHFPLSLSLLFCFLSISDSFAFPVSFSSPFPPFFHLTSFPFLSFLKFLSSSCFFPLPFCHFLSSSLVILLLLPFLLPCLSLTLAFWHLQACTDGHKQHTVYLKLFAVQAALLTSVVYFHRFFVTSDLESFFLR